MVQQLQSQLRGYQEKWKSCERELVRKEGELVKSGQERERLQGEVAAASHHIKQLQSQLHVSAECDQRKEQLLQLQKSKMERCMAEIETLKKVSDFFRSNMSYSDVIPFPPPLSLFLSSLFSLPYSPSHNLSATIYIIIIMYACLQACSIIIPPILPRFPNTSKKK